MASIRRSLADLNLSKSQLKEITVQASAAITATTTNIDSGDLSIGTAHYKGLQLYMDITAKSGTSPTLDVKLQVKDPVSAKFIDMTSVNFAQKTDTFTGYLSVYPGVAETANVSINDTLPKTWRIVCTIGGTDTPTFTFSLGACLIP